MNAGRLTKVLLLQLWMGSSHHQSRITWIPFSEQLILQQGGFSVHDVSQDIEFSQVKYGAGLKQMRAFWEFTEEV